MFGDTPQDKTAVTQIQTILTASDAEKNCVDTLAKADQVFKTLTSEDARKTARALMNDFSDKNCGLDIMAFLKSPKGLAIVGVLVVLLLLRK